MTPQQKQTLEEHRKSSLALPSWEMSNGDIVALLLVSVYGRHGELPHEVEFERLVVRPDGSCESGEYETYDRRKR